MGETGGITRTPSKLSTGSIANTNRDSNTNGTQGQIAETLTEAETLGGGLTFGLHAKSSKIADNVKRRPTPARSGMPELQTEVRFWCFHDRFHFQKFRRTVEVIVSRIKLAPHKRHQPKLATPATGKH